MLAKYFSIIQNYVIIANEDLTPMLQCPNNYYSHHTWAWLNVAFSDLAVRTN